MVIFHHFRMVNHLLIFTQTQVHSGGAWWTRKKDDMTNWSRIDNKNLDSHYNSYTRMHWKIETHVGCHTRVQQGLLCTWVWGTRVDCMPQENVGQWGIQNQMIKTCGGWQGKARQQEHCWMLVGTTMACRIWQVQCRSCWTQCRSLRRPEGTAPAPIDMSATRAHSLQASDVRLLIHITRTARTPSRTCP